MGKLCMNGSSIGICSSNSIFVYNNQKNSKLVFELPSNRCDSKDCKKKTKECKWDDIVSHVFSKNGLYLAAATQDKRLIVWNLHSQCCLNEKVLLKRPMAIDFTPDSSRIIVADKNGDVYSYPVIDKDISKSTSNCVYCSSYGNETTPEPLLGHLSMLLDMAITTDGKFLITCDRDEKIRISAYPNCYSIHTFCLGHTEFVSQVKLLSHQSHRLLSASGDHTIKLWNYLSGKCLATLDVRLEIENLSNKYLNVSTDESKEKKDDESMMSSFISQMAVQSTECGSALLSFSFYKLPCVLFYKIRESDTFNFLMSVDTSAPPIDLLFVGDREILVFTETSEVIQNPLTLYRFSQDVDSVNQIKDSPIVQFGEDYRDKLKGNDTWLLDAASLYKHKYDNVADYQKKKLERLENARPLSPKRIKICE